MHRRDALLAPLAAGLVVLAGCSSPQAGTPVSPAAPTSSSRPTSSAPVSVSATPPLTRIPSSTPHSPTRSASSTASAPTGGSAAAVLASMSEAQRVGQLLMIDNPSTSVSSTTVNAIARYHVGAVILDGDSSLSTAGTRAITDRLQDAAPAGVGLFVATDQEGGLVRRLQGPGFSDIPSAVTQGGYAPSQLQADAAEWGQQLRAAGVNVDLAPVLDTVPAGGGSNPPIGDLDREYGHTPAVVAAHGVAFARGLAEAGVDATGKHFPGLGRVSGNTDTTSGVTDSVTTRDNAYLAPFRAAVRAGIPFVMMSTAIYSRIDPGTPAAFSHTVVTGMLRDELGFRGVVISDDLGAARQVEGYGVGERAVDFVAAGGDMALTVVATQAGTMAAALLARAEASPAFKQQVDAAALTVLQAKQTRGLLG